MNQIALYQAIVKKQQFSDPTEVSSNCTDLIHKLLVKDPKMRLGSLVGGELDITGHVWFSDLDVVTLRCRETTAPWIPTVRDPFDTSNFGNWDKFVDRTTVSYPALCSSDAALFENF